MTTSSPAAPARALVLATWRSAFNDGWRFGRSGPWMALAHLLLAGLTVWRLSVRLPEVPAGTLFLLVFDEAWLLALLRLLLRGRERLYTGPLVSLVHLSPAPAQAVVLADVIGTLPQRAWAGLLFTLALFPVARPAGPWAVASLLPATLAGGVLGHLTGLVGLVSLVRRRPGALVALPAAGMVLGLSMLLVITYLLVGGLWEAGLAEPGAPGPGGGRAWSGEMVFTLLLSLPGLLWLAGPMRRRGGEALREGWLAVREMADRGSRPLRSRWPALLAGPAGALQAQAWLMARRNWFSLIRLGLAVGGLLLPLFLGRHLTGSRATTICVAMGLLFGIFNYGEQAAGLFSADGERAALPVLAGVRPHQVLLGKWAAGLPVPLVAGMTTLVWAWSAGVAPAQALGLAGTALTVALGCLTWIIGAAAFDAAPGRAALRGDGDLAMAFEQVPTRPGGIVGLAGAALLAGAGLWLHARTPAWLPALAPLPVLAALAGVWRVRRLMRTGVEG